MKTKEIKKKVWVMTQESNVNGEILFDVLVCDSKEIARAEMTEEIEWIRTESHHFRNYDECPDDFEIVQDEDSFSIIDPHDDYWEEIIIEEKEVITK